MNSSKIADVSDSVLYAEVRAKLDRECAAAGDGIRIALEGLADMISERVRSDSSACGQILQSDKTITGAYEQMRKTVEDRVKPKRGEISCGWMSGDEALSIALGYYGIAGNVPRKEQAAEAPAGKVKSIFDFM